jgi:hypothetical protein
VPALETHICVNAALDLASHNIFTRQYIAMTLLVSCFIKKWHSLSCTLMRSLSLDLVIPLKERLVLVVERYWYLQDRAVKGTVHSYGKSSVKM